MPTNEEFVKVTSKFNKLNIESQNTTPASKFLLRSMRTIKKNKYGNFRYGDLINFMKIHKNNQLFYKGRLLTSNKNISRYWNYAHSHKTARIPEFNKMYRLCPQTNEKIRDAKLYSYILACDVGGAPCVENGCLTIAICKQVMRKNAHVGDTIVGISGYKLGKIKKIIFIATITRMMTMVQYGDCNRSDSIYTSDLKLKAGAKFHDCSNYEKDISGKNVIISRDFIYFGKKNIKVPNNLRGIIPGRETRCTLNVPFKKALMDLFTVEKKKGIGKRGDYTGKKIANAREMMR
jgi:hypothetical protein